MSEAVERITGPSFTHDNHYGAQTLPDGQVRFRLWAPDAQQVTLLLEQTRLPMQREANGEFSLRVAAPAGARYRYLIDDIHAVPDPAARAQDQDIDGASVVVDPAAYRWQHPHWRGRPWHEAVICEVHVGALGGFDGVRQRLSQWRDAGYSAIELMPIAEFPGARNWGYDGVLTYAVEASYGSPESLKALIDEAHGLGLMVLLDVVYNHFGPDGNYLGQYAGAFFRQDQPTPWGAAIDFRQRAVQRFFIDNALMWLNEYRFDGLRFDAVHTISPSAFLDQLAEAIHAATEPGRQVHLVLENEHNSASLLQHAYDAQWNDDGHNALHVLLTGEHEGYYADYAADPGAQLARVLAEGFAFQGQPDRRGSPRGEPSADLPPTAFVLFAQNHDQIGNRPMGDRLSTLVDPDRLRAAVALVALSPMIPLFFMGEEWGCRTPFLFFTSHRGELAEAVREGRRSEFAHFAGFSDPARRAAIPDPNAENTFAASRPAGAEEPEAIAWRAWFSELLALRRTALIPRLHGSRSEGCQVLAPGALLACWALGDGSQWRLAVNLGTQPAQLPTAPSGRLLYRWPEAGTALADPQTLPPASLQLYLAEPRHD